MYDFGARWFDMTRGQWTSIDPLTEKYYSYSPYSFCMDNPVKYFDPNGKEVWINYGKNQRVEYRDGKLYNKDGSVYAGKVKGFLKQSVNALDKISESKTGKELIGELASSSNVFNIRKGSGDNNKFVSEDKDKAYSSQIKTDPSLNVIYKDRQESGKSLEGGSGGTIYWNPNGADLPTTSGVQNNSEINLGHEMSHGLDANRGLLDNRMEDGIKRDEWQATYKENTIRQDLSIPLRTHYQMTVDGNTTTGGTGPSMLNSNNQPIVPFWYKP